MISIDLPLIFSIFEMIVSIVVLTIISLHMLRIKIKRWKIFIFIGCWMCFIAVHIIMDIATMQSYLINHFFINLLLTFLPLFILNLIIATFKENEKKHILENEFYSSIFNMNHIKTLIFDSDTADVIDCNPAACTYYGYPHEEMVKKNITDINVESINNVQDMMKQSFKNGQVHFLGQHKLSSGEIRDVEVSIGPIRIKERYVIYCMIQDISEIQNLKRALEDISYKFQELFNNSKDAIFLSSIDDGILSNFIEVNEVATDMLGYTKDEFLHMRPRDFISDKKLLPPMNDFIKRILKDKSIIIEGTVIAKNGSKLPAEISIHISNFEGQTVLLSFMRNITERKRWEEQLKKLSEALEQSTSSVTIMDLKGNIEYVNSKFTKITGYTFEEVKGHNAKMLMEDNDQGEYCQSISNMISTGEEFKGEYYTRTKSGVNYWASVSTSCIRNEHGKITNFIGIREDITDKKLYENTLRQKNDELNDVISKLKTAQIQIIQQEKLAGIGQLAAGVAHEINNPLGFVISNQDTLRKYFTKIKEVLEVYKQYNYESLNSDKETLKERIKYINELEAHHNIDFIIKDLHDLFKDTSEGFDRINEIVQSLRTFSRIDAVQEYEEYDLNQGIETTLKLANNEIKYYAEVQKDFKDIPLIYASGGEINQVLLNIIVNAVQAIKEKIDNTGGLIKISTFSDEYFVYCVVDDNGSGIPKENFKNLFNPFYTTKPVGEGTGLGLSISYDLIVNKHGGELIVESQNKLWTKITIKLPINKLHNTVSNK